VPRFQQFFRSLRELSRSFWTANVSELFERIAFYGMTPVLVPYLTQVRGFEAGTAIRLSGNFGLVVYGLPVLSGFLADLLGYRRAMMLAYGVLAAGYLLLGRAGGFTAVAGSLLLIALGASLIKPTITGTTQRTCSETLRPLGFSIYYTLVNIGGFLGPNISGQVSAAFGPSSVFWTSAAAVAAALVLVLVMFREPPAPEGVTEKKRLGSFLADFARVVTNPRLVVLFLLVAGFWSLFFQFYGAFTLYMTRDLGLSQLQANRIISLDALAIILFQVVVGYLVRKLATSRAVWIAALVASGGIAVIGLRASWTTAAAGVLIFSVGEMIYSAHFYAYLGKLAPPGQVGMYMGFAFLPIALGSFLSGQIGGPVSSYFRDTVGEPRLMWFAFAAVGLVSALGLALLSRVAERKEAVSGRG
jgi:POT family proton-dependent oligopeptide transporter